MKIKTLTKKYVLGAVAASCVAALSLAATTAYAESPESGSGSGTYENLQEVQFVLAEGTQDKLDSANSAIEELRKEQGNISTEITDLNEKAEAAGKRINELNEDIIRKQEDVAGVNEDIAGIEDDMSARYKDMKLRIRYIYESGDMGLIEALLSSEEFSDMLNRAEYIQKIYDYDRNELEVMAGLYKEHEEKLHELETEVASLEGLKTEADEEARSLEALLIDKQDELKLSADKITQLEELAKKYEKQLEEERLAREEEERKKREEEEKRKKEEAERKAREEAAAKAAAEEAEKKVREEEAARAAAANNNAAAPSTTLQSRVSSGNSSGNAGNGSGNSGSVNNSSSTNSNSSSNNSPASNAAAAASSNSSSSASGYSANDLAMMAAIIEVEAGDQCYEGRLAVGSVVMNRVESSKFPNTISGVIYQSGQFSPVASGRFAACLARGAEATNVQAAKDVLGGVRNVPYLFFRMHYGNTNANYSSYTIIQDHILYNY